MIAWHAALAQVFYLKNNPQALHSMQQAPLPNGMASVIRLASDSGSLLDNAANELEMDSTSLQQAVSEYLIAICLFPGSNVRRTLGLNEQASPETAKDHYRLLLKWLHPDKNQQNKNYAERVNHAWGVFKASELNPEPLAFTPANYVQISDARQLPASRFPIFIVGLLCLALVLLAIAFLPDNTVYVSGLDDAEISNQQSNPSEIPTEFEASLIERIKPAIFKFKPAKPSALKVKAVLPKVKNTTSTASVAKQQLPVDNQNIKPVLAQQEVPDEVQMKHVTVSNPLSSTHVENQAAAELNAEKQSGVASVKQGIQVLSDFSQRYGFGNISYFMQLFSATAQNESGDRKAIEQDYHQFFENSIKRQIQFSQLQWRNQNQKTLSLQAFYVTKVKWHKIGFASSTEGQIQLNFIEENGKVKIQQILIKE